MENDSSCKHNKAGVALFISDKVDFRTRSIIKDKISNDERVKSSRRPNNYNHHAPISRS